MSLYTYSHMGIQLQERLQSLIILLERKKTRMYIITYAH